jgi:hypothetical protein
MKTWWKLFDLAGGKPLPEEEDGPAHRYQLITAALLASCGLAAVYGLAAGSTDAALAAANVYKMPMVVVLSALSAVPAALVAWKLTGAVHKATDLLMGLAAGNFTGALVLAVLAPVVALYYHTSDWLGGALALAAASLALLVGFLVMLRGVAARVPKDVSVPAMVMPVVVMVGMQLAVMVQLIHVASPILPEITVFDGGMDDVLSRN